MIALVLLPVLLTSTFAQVCKVEYEKWDDKYKINTNDVNPDYASLGFTTKSDNFYMIPQSHMPWSEFPDRCDALCNSIPICMGWKIHQKFDSKSSEGVRDDWHCCHLVSYCEEGTLNSYSDDWTRSCCGPQPTPEPTAEPTILSNTQTPTAEPTSQPTAEPTNDPTADPTAEPTSRPTSQPTNDPTADPTSQPTADPTSQPTAEPTANPTYQPTKNPTAEPTANPTPMPTNQPTPEPTANPTFQPTKQPTAEPTANPTHQPTANPTPEPTANPTHTPTKQPTHEPTWSSRPTMSPTLDPTYPGETSKPTLAPTTAFPTLFPTPSPTTSPFAGSLVAPQPEPEDGTPFFSSPLFWGPLLLALLALLAFLLWKYCRNKKQPERLSQQPLNLSRETGFNTFQAEDPELTIGQEKMDFEPLPAPPVIVEPGVMSDDESQATKTVAPLNLPPAKPERAPTLKWRLKM